MSDGFGVTSEDLVRFAKHLDDLEADLRESGKLAGSCVGDPGIFGIVGQVFGTVASVFCSEAQGQLDEYAGTIADLADRLRHGAKKYEEEEHEADDAISEYQL